MCSLCNAYGIYSNANLKKIFHLFIFRERGREGEKEGEKHWCLRETSICCLSNIPKWGPGPQPRHVPWLGIEWATFQLTGQRSIHWATPARAKNADFLFLILISCFFFPWSAKKQMFNLYFMSVLLHYFILSTLF